MTTVNFQCGHCHNLMAVGQEFLGQQVRCPHCQQVVLAPAPVPAPAPFSVEAPAIEVPGADEQESIFTPPDASDDLFGIAAALPQVEIPAEPAAFPQLALNETTMPAEATPPAPQPAAPPDLPTVTYAGPEPPPSAPVNEVVPPADAGPFAPAAGAPAAPAEEGLPLLTVQPRHRVGRSNPWVIPLVIAPLAFYSFMATLYILDMKFFHFFSPAPPHPLEILPDLEGDNKGAAKRGSVTRKLPDPDQPLAAHMRVPLGGTLAVGDLQVRPERVERKRIAIDISNARSEPAREDSLVLYLRLRNRSRDVTFKPMDRYFARRWTKQPGDNKPFTLLEVGARRFYGGPLAWVSLAAARKQRSEAYVEYVHQQTVNQELKPGEEMTTFVCTNPDEHAVKALDGYQGPLLWHVQLRRGLVRWTTRDGVDREDPATTVVGVEFTAADVKKPAD